MPRLHLNQSAPDFQLADFSGQPVSLADFRGRKHVYLVLNRSFA